MSMKSIQQQLGRNRGKTAVLGILTAVLAVMGFKAVTSMMPQSASAMLPANRSGAPGAESPRPLPDNDLEKKARESQMLWSVLREKRGLEADVAFRFDPTYYNVDPARQRERDLVNERITPVPEKSDHISTDQQLATVREAHVRDQARTLTLQTTILGQTPSAVIATGGNSRLVHVGETISGFKVVAIEGRVVQIEKEGITLGLRMDVNESRP